MDTYCNVTFDKNEARLLGQLARNLRIRFDRMDNVVAQRREGTTREPDMRARAALACAKNRDANHQQVTDAWWAADQLRVVLLDQSRLEWWLDEHEHSHGERLRPDGNPTSAYHQLSVLAEIRTIQLGETERAIALLSQAAQLVTPRQALAQYEGV